MGTFRFRLTGARNFTVSRVGSIPSSCPVSLARGWNSRSEESSEATIGELDLFSLDIMNVDDRNGRMIGVILTSVRSMAR